MQLRVTVPMDPDWLASDELQLVIGSENVASLALSTPAGGSVVTREKPKLDDDEVVLTHRHFPADRCGVLPVGVRIADDQGNVSAVVETIAAIADRPRGARSPELESTGNPLEARLTWTASPDV